MTLLCDVDVCKYSIESEAHIPIEQQETSSHSYLWWSIASVTLNGFLEVVVFKQIC